ncbi:MAG: hypothetical protein IKP69_10640 [Oscillospiraceae bacterium]|nr:hypothetical protein [Oscillospiraceae bacterium]
MPRKKKTTDEQLADAELEEKKLKDIIKKKNEQLKIIENRKKQLTARKDNEKQKARTHHFCEIAGTLYKVLGRDFEDGDVERLENFLNGQEQRGGYFSKAMNTRPETEIDTNESEPATEEQQFSDATKSGLCIQGNYDG